MPPCGAAGSSDGAAPVSVGGAPVSAGGVSAGGVSDGGGAASSLLVPPQPAASAAATPATARIARSLIRLTCTPSFSYLSRLPGGSNRGTVLEILDARIVGKVRRLSGRRYRPVLGSNASLRPS